MFLARRKSYASECAESFRGRLPAKPQLVGSIFPFPKAGNVLILGFFPWILLCFFLASSAPLAKMFSLGLGLFSRLVAANPSHSDLMTRLPPLQLCFFHLSKLNFLSNIFSKTDPKTQENPSSQGKGLLKKPPKPPQNPCQHKPQNRKKQLPKDLQKPKPLVKGHRPLHPNKHKQLPRRSRRSWIFSSTKNSRQSRSSWPWTLPAKRRGGEMVVVWVVFASLGWLFIVLFEDFLLKHVFLKRWCCWLGSRILLCLDWMVF